jgi:phosphoglucosamine mutase
MLFGSSGIRQRYSRELVILAQRVGAAVGSQSAQVLLGMDTRRTGMIIGESLISGILSAGGSVGFAGICPTPAIGFCARTTNAGCMVTASHNPEPDNGIKLFNPDGSSFTKKQQQEIADLVTGSPAVGWDRYGVVHSYDTLVPYRDAVLAQRTCREGLPVILDCGNGAASAFSPKILAGLGAAVQCINCNTAERFGRPSEPVEANLGYIGAMVRESGAEAAVVHDGDADRMMAFDSRGRFISGDRMLMLFVRYLGAKRVVTTFDASMAIEEVAEVRRTPVGDSYVSEALLSWGSFGGEPSGAWIFPDHSLCPDGPYAAALFCEIASEWDIVKELDTMPEYPMYRESVQIENPLTVMKAIGAENPTDGIRIAKEEGWCLVRASGTEQKIRITAEGRDSGTAKEMLETGRALVRQRKNA